MDEKNNRLPSDLLHKDDRLYVIEAYLITKVRDSYRDASYCWRSNFKKLYPLQSFMTLSERRFIDTGLNKVINENPSQSYFAGQMYEWIGEYDGAYHSFGMASSFFKEKSEHDPHLSGIEKNVSCGLVKSAIV